MSVNKSRPDEPTKILDLTYEAACSIFKKHGHKEAAQKIVDALPNRASLNSTEVAERVQGQILHFAQSLVKSVKRASEAAGKVRNLPQRAAQGAALRQIRDALESLRDAIEHNWELAGPLLEIETAEQLGRLLTTEATKELLPARLRTEHIKASANKVEYILQGLKRSFLLKAGSRPVTQLIEGAKIVVLRAERRIPSGAPLKVPLEMALIMGLADHFEWAIGQKAAWVEGGPFSKFCIDVFERLELQPAYSWEHLLRQGLKHYRSAFVARRRHERPDDPTIDGGLSRKRKTRKKQLVPLRKRKTIQNQ